MSTYKITLVGIERYLESKNRSVFDRLVLPDGIDKDLMVNNIILQAEEKELLYSDPDFLTSAIEVWSRKYYWTFDKWVKAINTQYEPLWNFDRHEEWEDSHSNNSNRNKNGSYDQNYNDSSEAHTDSNDFSDDNSRMIHDTKVETDQTVEGKESAFNADDYQEKTKDITDSEVTTSGEDRSISSLSSTSNSTSGASNLHNENGSNTENENTDEAGNASHRGHLYGNIGITSSQQLLESEFSVAEFSLYDRISDLFISEFCLMVY